MRKHFLILSFFVIANSYVAEIFATEAPFKQERVSKSGRLPNDGVRPKEGFVPDGATAISVAVAVLGPIYGVDEIEKQKPFSAALSGGVWVVQGSMEKRTGIAEVNISKRTGAILRVTHGK